MFEITESPIEEKMRGALQRWGLSFSTQVPIGKYRVDFLLEDERFGNSKVIIECDGVEFHQDEKRERERDAYLTTKGYNVAHFTGADIYRKSYDCVGKMINRFWPEVGNLDDRWLPLHRKWEEWGEIFNKPEPDTEYLDELSTE